MQGEREAATEDGASVVLMHESRPEAEMEAGSLEHRGTMEN